jgi:hypothetical protein
MNSLNPQRFDHEMSEPKPLWVDDLIEMAELRASKSLYLITAAQSMAHPGDN